MSDREGVRRASHDRPSRRRRAPLNIGVAPTIRLSDEITHGVATVDWRPGVPAPGLPRVGSVKPPVRRALGALTPLRVTRASLVPSVPRGAALAAPFTRSMEFTGKSKRRCLLLLGAASISFALAFYTPIAVLAALVCAAASIAELRWGWSRISPSAHGMAAASLALSAAAVVTQAAGWLLHVR
jgi:hypothetical protein